LDTATEVPESSQQLWSCEDPQVGQRPEKLAEGFGVRESNPNSIAQDWKLTVAVAASPYVGCHVVDEEWPTTYCVVAGLVGIAPGESFLHSRAFPLLSHSVLFQREK
jgi:hypothetical protein